jgi:hypothetical protein
MCNPSAGHWRAQAAVTRPPRAVQVQLLPDGLSVAGSILGLARVPRSRSGLGRFTASSASGVLSEPCSIEIHSRWRVLPTPHPDARRPPSPARGEGRIIAGIGAGGWACSHEGRGPIWRRNGRVLPVSPRGFLRVPKSDRNHLPNDGLLALSPCGRGWPRKWLGEGERRRSSQPTLQLDWLYSITARSSIGFRTPAPHAGKAGSIPARAAHSFLQARQVPSKPS